MRIFFAILGDSFYPQMIRVCRCDGINKEFEMIFKDKMSLQIKTKLRVGLKLKMDIFSGTLCINKQESL